MAALEAANRSEEQKQLTNVRGVLNWLEHKSSHAPDLNAFAPRMAGPRLTKQSWILSVEH